MVVVEAGGAEGAIEARPMIAPYFNANRVKTVSLYVAWLDVMGSRLTMTRSLAASANFVGKLHASAIANAPSALSLCPMNDGLFAVADDIFQLKDFLRGCAYSVEAANAKAREIDQVFLTRAGIAFGQVLEGKNTAGASPALDSKVGIRDAILLGPPVVQAFEAEVNASPFGVYVHESARTFATAPHKSWSQGAYMRYWSRGEKPSEVLAIEQRVTDYLEYCSRHSLELGYPEDRIARHRQLAAEYFDY